MVIFLEESMALCVQTHCVRVHPDLEEYPRAVR